MIIRQFERTPYTEMFENMRSFTLARTENTEDEIWLCEHEPVFTQGQAGKPEHVLFPGDIPVVQSDRGGQVTYHGPGQLMIYTLIDVKRQGSGVKKLVSSLEDMVIELLKAFSISAFTEAGKPGVYTTKGKICSIGLRIKKGCSYHGLCLNVCGDLTPFTRINPCGFAKQPITNIAEFTPVSMSDVMVVLSQLTRLICK